MFKTSLSKYWSRQCTVIVLLPVSILEYTWWEYHLTILKKKTMSNFNLVFPLSFLPRSSSLCHTGLWPSRPADWCSDPNLWRPGFFVHRHLDTGGGGGWPQAGGGHRHQHPLPHSAWPAATTCLQVHEGLYFALNSCRMADLMFSAFQFLVSLPHWYLLVCCLQLSDHCDWALWQHQCSGKDPARLLLWSHLHPPVGKWPQVDAQSSPGREWGSPSAGCGSALDHDGGTAGRHPMQVRLEVNQRHFRFQHGCRVKHFCLPCPTRHAISK